MSVDKVGAAVVDVQGGAGAAILVGDVLADVVDVGFASWDCDAYHAVSSVGSNETVTTRRLLPSVRHRVWA